jgi:hypothetical protein
MNVIVAIVGWIILTEGLLGIALPHLLLNWVIAWSPDLRFYATVGTRIVIGLLLLFAAPSCRLPRFTRVIGIITFVAGIVYALIGTSRLDSMIQWVSAQPSWAIQLLYALATVLGGFLAYSGSQKKAA